MNVKIYVLNSVWCDVRGIIEEKTVELKIK